ncbi:GNAT family N-acetyltransferase [Pseudonocardia humida]|uniref:GNAT family N-acetyltransferase n=1 Tax=Pseudonocardia humida TaxID=2800819 RepID=UPI00207C3390|nr:GNAT family protein [Pseudonocardia humida]
MHLEPTYPVDTARLVLRPLADTDVDELLTYRGRADVCRYLPFEPMTRETLRARLGADLSRSAITAEGQALTLGVRVRDTGRLVGDVVLFFRSQEHARGEIGYAFHPDVAGRGYASEACSALLGLGFDQLGLHRVIARLDSRNEASARLAARLGMRREAHFVRSEMAKGEWVDQLVFAMLAEEWPGSAAHRVQQRGRGTAPGRATDG